MGITVQELLKRMEEELEEVKQREEQAQEHGMKMNYMGKRTTLQFYTDLIKYKLEEER